MESAWLVFLSVLTPLALVVPAIAWRSSARAQRTLAVAGSALALVVTSALVFAVDRAGYLVWASGGWSAPVGIVLVADRLGAIMAWVSSLTALACSVYAVRDLEEAVHRRGYAIFHLALLAGVNGAFLTGDLFNLYVWFEVMLLSSFVLLVIGRRREQLAGGVKYVVLNILSSVLFLGAAGVIYGKTGTLNFAELALRQGDPATPAIVGTSATLLLVAFGLKAGVFPLFAWLPAAYPTASPAIAALFAGLLTKVGVYAVLRFATLLFPSTFEELEGVVAIVAGLTMLLGVFGAAAHFGIRRILSFHIVSQIGYMIVGIVLLTPAALAGTVFYLVHHIIVKANLFLVGGILARRSGPEDDDGLARLGGFLKASPLLAVLFFIPAFSLGGIPPLSGFWAKLAIIQAGLEAGAWTLVGVALGVGLLTLYSMTKIWAEVFWKDTPPGIELRPATRGDGWLFAPVAALALLTVGLGLFGGPFLDYSQRAADQLLDPASYATAVLGPKSVEVIP